MTKTLRLAASVLALCVIGVPVGLAQSALAELMRRHGIETGNLEAAFDSNAMPAIPVTPGAMATPLGMLTASTGADRINAAYAFGILAGRSGRAAAPQELAAAGQALVAMINSGDRRSRIAGARVAGRVFAAPFDGSAAPSLPPGLVDALYATLNLDAEVDQLVAMDALGLIRERSAVAALTERYHYYRDARSRARAGGAIEALARIGDRSSIELVRQVAADAWSAGNDPTALAVAFARERLLQDGSVAVIQKALGENKLRDQARGYLAELGVP